MVPTWWATVASVRREEDQTWSSRGSKSRNKVSVGEPAEGSLSQRVLDVRVDGYAHTPDHEGKTGSPLLSAAAASRFDSATAAAPRTSSALGEVVSRARLAERRAAEQHDASLTGYLSVRSRTRREASTGGRAGELWGRAGHSDGSTDSRGSKRRAGRRVGSPTRRPSCVRTQQPP